MCLRRLSLAVYSVISAHAASRERLPAVTRASSGSGSYPHNLDDDPLASPPVELSVEHLFPGAEVERTGGDGQDHLMPHDGPLQMRVGIVFASLMVLVREAGRRQLLEPFLKIVDEAVLPVVDVNAGRNVHRRHEHDAFLHPTLLDDRGNLVGDAQ